MLRVHECMHACACVNVGVHLRVQCMTHHMQKVHTRQRMHEVIYTDNSLIPTVISTKALMLHAHAIT